MEVGLKGDLRIELDVGVIVIVLVADPVVIVLVADTIVDELIVRTVVGVLDLGAVVVILDSNGVCRRGDVVVEEGRGEDILSGLIEGGIEIEFGGGEKLLKDIGSFVDEMAVEGGIFAEGCE